MLSLSDVHVNYGHVNALKGISLQVDDGKIVSLLGANGAGKTTTLKMISRLVKPKKGAYEMDGKSMIKEAPSSIVKKGVIHCPENRRVFPLFSVEENLIIGAYNKRNKSVKQEMEKVFSYFPILKDRLKQKAGTLSGGEQQMLAIGRALMGKPNILLLDEPSLGLAPKIVNEIFSIIKEINKSGTSILIVEQNAYKAIEISDYSYVLENGTIALQGTSEELKNNDEVRRLYLGG
ncbi:ABC transporter ATP-binding protein [Oceanobacillus piezotolerans]|uniref:ABC transporter ATP-binding protein n=1 Tax=Oceanobacillus piezotolerans TaxID=2448030 RepID=A0A498DFV4_9BACI|nr:ABC transporter ATP-binding protein [Oceanobacillus piezotolerans]RLL46831.1 ABC transporter ATP-binding protein [Oceanobacillus piezotolerans]